MTTDEYRGDPARHWTIGLRLAIEASDADAARAINEDVLQKMGVVAEAEPQLTRSASPQPCWYVISKLDLSGLETITPDDALTRFRFVIRELPGVSFSGGGSSHSGLWQWLPDEWGSDGRRVFPHPAVRAAGIHIADRRARPAAPSTTRATE
jgi:hypothetical protein